MAQSPTPGSRILVIKLAALGDVVQAFGPFAAIHAAHPDSHITLLTTPPYAEFLGASPWFDDVWTDTRPRALAAGAWLALRRRLIDAGFTRVYDLQTSDRSSTYYRLFWPGRRPAWSGIARGCSHPHANPDRDAMHTIDRQREQLEMAGITAFPEPDLAWLSTHARVIQDGDYALIVPGGSAGRPRKRWPADRFAALAQHLVQSGTTPLVLGSGPDRSATADVIKAVPEAVDLTGRTSLFDVFGLAQGARLAVGNDTGPMHLIAAAGCSTTVLFSDDSDPTICVPRGPDVRVVRRSDLGELPASVVAESLGIS